ncbi:MAG: DUF4381 domain-containing protein [Gammaproteobacteria bacterium]|jgi:hypothetical protein|nr:DUF4381 domain-containing protein [Gammaproteobacteria bacterium]MDX2460224.1 DUF4381 domain-containing protein [Gammaproteobacteria bacterium]
MRLLAQLPMDPLSELRDIHLPPPPPLWPPAPGWWLLGCVLIVAAALATRLALTRWRRGRGRRAAVRAMAELRNRYRNGEARDVLTAELATLLRRAAMNRHPRVQVAGLTGRDWLEFLDDDTHQFTNGVGACLSTAPYARGQAPDFDALFTLCEKWVRRNA